MTEKIGMFLKYLMENFLKNLLKEKTERELSLRSNP